MLVLSKQTQVVTLIFIGPCIANIFSEHNQQDITFLKFSYFCKTLYMFQTVFSVPYQEHKTAHTTSGICQTVTSTCC